MKKQEVIQKHEETPQQVNVLEREDILQTKKSVKSEPILKSGEPATKTIDEIHQFIPEIELPIIEEAIKPKEEKVLEFENQNDLLIGDAMRIGTHQDILDVKDEQILNLNADVCTKEKLIDEIKPKRPEFLVIDPQDETLASSTEEDWTQYDDEEHE